MKKGRKKEKKEINREEISEIFEVENGKEKVIKTHKIIEEKEKAPTEEQIKKEKEIFKKIIIVIAGFVLMFLAVLFIINYINHFNVGGVIFNTDRTAMAGKTLYRTSLPVYGHGEITGKVVTGEYNFWLRNDPRQLKEDIPFYGIIKLKKNVVINSTRADGFMCGGDGMIGVANLLNLYKIIGTNVTKDENASCDSLGRYGFINIIEGNETYIDRYGPACYNLYVKDCEILKATERLMLEIFINTNQEVR